jgi:hypothetical protein
MSATTLTPAQTLQLGQRVIAACSALRYLVTGVLPTLDVPEGNEQCGSFMAVLAGDKDSYVISPFIGKGKNALHYLVVTNLDNGTRLGVFTAKVDKARQKAEAALRQAEYDREMAERQAIAETLLENGEAIDKVEGAARYADTIAQDYTVLLPHGQNAYDSQRPIRWSSRRSFLPDVVMYHNYRFTITK